MEIQLISGNFSIAEAKKLLDAVYKTKIRFHEEKLAALNHPDETARYSEQKIQVLKETLQNAIQKLRQSGKTHTSLNAHIEVSMADLSHQ